MDAVLLLEREDCVGLFDRFVVLELEKSRLNSRAFKLSWKELFTELEIETEMFAF